MSKLDTQGLGTLVVEINKSLNTQINNSIDKIDLSPLATKTEVNELKSAVEGTVKARSNAEYTTSQMRNIILSRPRYCFRFFLDQMVIGGNMDMIVTQKKQKC